MLDDTILLLVLLIYWIFLHGSITAGSLIAGCVSCVLILKIMHRTITVSGQIYAGPSKSSKFKISSYFFLYIPWLAYQIVLSGLSVTRIVWHKTPLNPALVETKPSNKTDFGFMVLSNSITLTPGTVSLEEHGIEGIKVHTLHTLSQKNTTLGLNAFGLKVNKMIKKQ